MPAEWHFVHEGAASFRLQLEALPSGQVGVFPEQRENWDWIARQVARKPQAAEGRPLRVLNLFAYTGGSTLAAAAAGRKSCISMRPKTSWTARGRMRRSPASPSGRFAGSPEDAMKFCRREVKRGNQYDAVILDPPTLRPRPQGRAVEDRRALLPLLEDVRRTNGREPRVRAR